jgi:hypothetical protein
LQYDLTGLLRVFLMGQMAKALKKMRLSVRQQQGGLVGLSGAYRLVVAANAHQHRALELLQAAL